VLYEKYACTLLFAQAHLLVLREAVSAGGPIGAAIDPMSWCWAIKERRKETSCAISSTSCGSLRTHIGAANWTAVHISEGTCVRAFVSMPSRPALRPVSGCCNSTSLDGHGRTAQQSGVHPGGRQPLPGIRSAGLFGSFHTDAGWRPVPTVDAFGSPRRTAGRLASVAAMVREKRRGSAARRLRRGAPSPRPL